MPYDVSVIPQEELEEFKEIFKVVDQDGSGEIGIDEIRDLMNKLGLSIGDDQLEKMITAVDEDGSGEIGFNEFCGVMHASGQLQYDKATVKRAFYSTAGEAPHGCANLKAVEQHVMEFHTNPEEAIEAIKVLRATADSDGNGYIHIDEFVDTIMGEDPS